jgi:hypothetical protein
MSAKAVPASELDRHPVLPLDKLQSMSIGIASEKAPDES